MRHFCLLVLGILLSLPIYANPLIPIDKLLGPVDVNLKPVHQQMTDNFSPVSTENSFESIAIVGQPIEFFVH
ncbi:MAG: hypothetical protein MJK04_12915 [Psychrosphaera sp.]|nr:hypothetical protein [Psychrosphaera sp.]